MIWLGTPSWILEEGHWSFMVNLQLLGWGYRPAGFSKSRVPLQSNLAPSQGQGARQSLYRVNLMSFLPGLILAAVSKSGGNLGSDLALCQGDGHVQALHV